jgi:hypothetical protein
VLEAIAGRGDPEAAIEVLAAMPADENRGRLAADLLIALMRGEALLMMGKDVSGWIGRLLEIADQNPPQDPRWPKVRAVVRSGALVRDAAELRVEPRTALAELDTLAAEAGEDPGLRLTIEAARSALTFARAFQEGDMSVYPTLKSDLDSWRGMVGDNPQATGMLNFLGTSLDALAAHQRGADTAKLLDGIARSAQGLDPDDPVRQAFEESRLMLEIIGGSDSGQPETVASARAKMADLVARAEQAGLDDTQRGHHYLSAGAVAIRASWSEYDIGIVEDGIGYYRQAVATSGPGHPQRAFRLVGLALALMRHNELTNDLSDLRAAMDVLEEARQAAGGPGHPSWLPINELLSQVRQRLGDRAPQETALDGLRGIAWKVLLQDDTAAARAAAEDGADSTVSVAWESLKYADPADAVQALDSGRALMLFAATEFRDVGPRLVGAGRSDLAERWRRAEESGERDRMPTNLRGEVLGVLAEGSGLLDPPSLGEIQAALRRLDADALVYLVPAGPSGPGVAVVAPAEGPAGYLVLPGLAVEEGHEVEPYLSAIAHRDQSPRRPRTDLAGSLDALCEWAWRVAVGPIVETFLPRLPKPASGRPHRLILAPSGRLALIPWQAARRPDGVFALELAAFSQTASARMLCRAAALSPVPLAPVGLVVGDPDTGEAHDRLEAARIEAYAVHQAFYRGGRYLGTRADGTPSRAGAGTGGEVRDWLTSASPGAGPVLHLACHGVIETGGEDPTSYLLLAGGDRIAADEIIRLMAAAPDRAIALAVLAACHTGESVHGYDEAYSLGTALLAGGVRSVLSTQWAVPDDATSVLMFMVHHFLMTEKLPVWAALRRAQLWMLDDNRRTPPTMPGALRRRLDLAEPARIEAWAGFVHLGR